MGLAPKDLFSRQAADYARFRPVYPDTLFDYLASLVKERRLAWDCATGNGQAAVKLAAHFDRVIATDPTQNQLDHAVPHSKVEYRRASAEDSGLASRSVDVLTVAQAFHWFREDEFFAEAKRVLKPGGVLAFWCYELAKITPEVDAVVLEFYKGTLSGCWEKERRLVEEGYRKVRMPFMELAPPRFEMAARWTLDRLVGYLSTWSAYQTYLKKHKQNPLEPLRVELKKAWGRARERTASWDLALRVGRLALLCLLVPLVAGAEKAQVFMTARDSPLRLASTGTIAFADFAQPTEDQPFVLVDPAKTFQTLIGIGAALTDAAADTLASLPPEKRLEVVRSFFDPVKGIGYTLARTNINSCDFSSATYSYAAEGDKALRSFDISHDLTNRVPLIKEAQAAAGGRLTLFASPWSPPAWMKDNGDMLHGGRLKPEFYQTWANYYVKFIRAYEKQGIPVWGVTIQNEPMASQSWESCLYSAEEERDFLRDFLGPTLAGAGLANKKVLVWDHNRDLMYQRSSVILDDPQAAKYAWGIAYHWYEDWAGGRPLYDNVRRVAESYPNKPLFFSEGCQCPYDAAKAGDWSLGEKYGEEMIRDFNNGTTAWTDWNMVLDERGGPNHVGNFCFAALHVDTKSGALHYTNIYDYMGHFSKFIRPGAKRVAAASSRDALLSTAFLNPDGSLAIVVMNQGDKAVPYSLWLRGKAAALESPPHSIATLIVR